MGASSVSACSGEKDTLPRPWYERVQSCAATPSISAGASLSPSVSERWPEVAAAAEALRAVGTGGSLAGKEGTTVLGAAGAAGAEGLYVEAVVVVVVVAGFAMVVAGFAVVAVVVDAACALGGLAQAAQMLEDEKLRYDVHVREELSSRKAPLRAGVATIVWEGISESDVLRTDTLDKCGTPSRREVTPCTGHT